jgi:hypothetical protein
MMDRKIWYSELQFRWNPIDPTQGLMDLGYAIEFTTSTYWVVGLAVRATLDESYLAQLDDLTRKLLDERMAVLTRELEQTLHKATEPGDALVSLAARNPWSIHVTAPRSVILSASERKASDNATAEKLTENYLFKIFELARREKTDNAPTWPHVFHVGSTLASATHDNPTPLDAAPPWMLPPKTMIRPLSGHR